MKIALSVMALFAAACGTASKPAKKIAEAPPEYFRVDAASAGAVVGRIAFRGVRPPIKAISMESEAGCQQAHGGNPVFEDSAIVVKDGGVANAFVYIQSGLEGKTFEPAKETVVLDQQGCMFVPHIVGLRAGQTLHLRNTDSVSHNIHPLPRNNREWNEQEPPHSPDLEHKFARAEVMIPVKCDVHSWMHAYIGVLPHPYFAVTGRDGSFALKNVPPGEYTVAAWHEKFGERSQPVHLAASETARVNFTYP